MENIIKLSLISVAFLSQLNANEAQSVSDMFSNSKTSGQIRIGTYSLDPNSDADTQTVTAIGGQLKFETASFSGVSLGSAFYTAHTIDVLSGDDNKYSDFLTSSKESYTELAEAYLNYTNVNFNIRIGRQVIDTPLADSDDIAMTPNTFEAIVASYEFRNLGLTIVGANIQRMQGLDADYENVTKNSWMDTGNNGTNMLAILYTKDALEANVWYYDIGKTTDAFYIDASIDFDIDSAFNLTLGTQYLDENEKDASGIDGSIAGILAEASYQNITAMVAYNDVSVDITKSIFEGFGGGCSYTNMQTTTAAALDTDSSSYVTSLGYEIANINTSIAYGDFEADANNAGHLAEIDVSMGYTYKDGKADITLVYVDIDDKINSTNSSKEIKLITNYNF